MLKLAHFFQPFFYGILINDHIVEVRLSLYSDLRVNNTLMNMYVVCGKMSDAQKILDLSTILDLVSWNFVLVGYVIARNVEKAKNIYDRMPGSNILLQIQ